MDSLGFERICRTCMAESPALLSIFDKQPGAGDESSIAGMLRLFTTITAQPSDGLPPRVCITCLSEINRAISFKQKCERSENTLQSCLQQMAPKSTKEPAEAVTTEASPIEPELAGVGIIVASAVEEKAPAPQPQETDICSEPPAANCTIEEMPVDIEFYHHTETLVADPSFESTPTAADANGEAAQVADVQPPPTESGEPAALVESVEMVDSVEMVEYIEEEILSDQPDADSSTEEHIDDAADYNEIELHSADEMPPPIGGHQPASASAAFTCRKCSATFGSLGSLNTHYKLNKCTQQTFECAQCARVFVLRENLRTHIANEHSQEAQRRTCTACMRRFATVAEHAAHGKQCRGQRSYSCELCSKAFTMLSTLRDHLRVHSGERPFVCPQCGKGFTQKTNLKQHMLRHSQTKRWKCEHCEMAFVSKGERGQHELTHTGEHPHECTECGARFTTSSSLVKHRRRHTGERPYACEFCPMRFAALGTLKNHRRTHTGERPYKCDECDRTFAQRSDCVNHQRMHEVDLRLDCDFCERKFTRPNTLKAHENKHRKEGTDQLRKRPAKDSSSKSTTDSPATIELHIMGGDNQEDEES